MYEGKELSGHRKLVDIGLVNGDKLEVKAISRKEGAGWHEDRTEREVNN